MRPIDFEKYDDLVDRVLKLVEQMDLPDKVTDKVKGMCQEYISDDYDTYKMSDEGEYTYEDYCYQSQTATKIAAYLVCIPELYNKVFLEDSITPSEFLNTAHLFELMSLCKDKDWLKFLGLFAAAFKGLSLERFVKSIGNDEFSDDEELSEVDFYDSIRGMGTRNLTLLIEQVDCSRKIKNELKDAIINDDEESFFSICRLPDVNFQKAGCTAKTWYALSALNSFLNSNGEFDERLDTAVGDSNLYSDQTLADKVYDLFGPTFSDNVNAMLRTDFCELYNQMLTFEGFIVAMFKELKVISTNVSALKELGDFIKSDPYYSRLYEIVTIGNYDTCRYRINIPYEEFKNAFLSQLNLPPQVKEKKDQKDYYESVQKQSKEDCIKLYKALAENGLLAYDEETFYSFIYRMSFDYKGEKEPQQIEWKGKASELYQLIWWFAGEGGDTRLWSKNAKFFYLSNGEPIKTNGVKNQAIAPTKRMEAVFKALK